MTPQQRYQYCLDRAVYQTVMQPIPLYSLIDLARNRNLSPREIEMMFPYTVEKIRRIFRELMQTPPRLISNE